MPAPAPLRSAASQPGLPEAAGEARWLVRLLGRVQASDGAQQIEHFPSRAVAALLARLALAPQRAHAREELVELLWPGADPAVGRNRLRQTLSTLKSLLEPPGLPGQRIIDADRLHVRVLPGALDCDVCRYEQLLQAGQAAEALALYAGELMPGHYADWIIEERNRLAALQAQWIERQGRPAPMLPSLPTPPGPPPAAEPAALRLPSYLTRLFGTELPAARLRGQVLGHRLVTLLGPGGSGKTRLAVEVASALRDHPGWALPGGQDGQAGQAGFDKVCFVSLVSCFDATQFVEAVARALRLPVSADLGSLLPALNGLHLLLVLDNFEQLVPSSAACVAQLLDGLPRLHVLLTSRHRLGLDGEVLFIAEPLPLPAPDAALAEAAANPAVALFVDRARAARSDFHLGARNRAAIIGLVRTLHGLPLAIELAASRARSFPPAELLGLLQAGTGADRLALLERGGARGAHDPRHASMTEVIAWSWALLDPSSRQVLLALTLFPVHAGAAAVAAAAGLPLARAAAQLDELVAHSLARVAVAEKRSPRPGEEADASASRFELLEPVREFAALQPEPSDAARQRLQQWLLAWAQALPRPLRRSDILPELPLVLAMLAQAQAHPNQAVQLAVALRDFWESENLPARTLRGLQSALATLPARHPLLADAHGLLANLCFGLGFADEARRHADAALRAAGKDRPARALALVRRAWIEVAAGRAADRTHAHHHQVRAQLDEALALARAAGDRDAQARALHQLAILAAHLHASPQGADVAGAEAMFAECQALWLALGDHRRANARLRNRAQCWVQLGREDEAMAAYRACEQAAVDSGDWLGQIDSLISMAELLVRRRDWQAALETNRRCLALCWQHWHRHALAYALWNPPRVLARLRQPEAAMQLMAFASVFWTSQFGPLVRDDERHIRRVRGLVARQLGRARADELWQRGLALDVASAVRLLLPAR